MTWFTEYKQAVKKATNEHLKLWLRYINMFDGRNDADHVGEKKRQKYKELIHEEYKVRGMRKERSRERGKGKKQTV